MAEKQRSPLAQARAEKAEQRASEAEQVRAEVAAEARAVDDKTARLRALRLERDRQDGTEKPAPKKRAAAKPKIRRAKSSP